MGVLALVRPKQHKEEAITSVGKRQGELVNFQSEIQNYHLYDAVVDIHCTELVNMTVWAFYFASVHN